MIVSLPFAHLVRENSRFVARRLRRIGDKVKFAALVGLAHIEQRGLGGVFFVLAAGVALHVDRLFLF